MIREVEYFESAGLENTQRCIDICKAVVEEGIRDVVVASTTGDVGVRFATALSHYSPLNLVVVTHSAGFAGENKQELVIGKKRQIESLNGKILTATILTHSLETSLGSVHSGAYPTIIIGQTLRRLGQGLKVCCEIVMEACDAGLIPEGIDVLSVGGTAKGADTVCIIKSAASKRFLELKVRQILAKPGEW